MFRDSAAGLSTHIKGVSQLLQTRGPEQYKTGVLHKLFVGFRPLLVRLHGPFFTGCWAELTL
jgi:hypothetical protein